MDEEREGALVPLLLVLIALWAAAGALVGVRDTVESSARAPREVLWVLVAAALGVLCACHWGLV